MSTSLRARLAALTYPSGRPDIRLPAAGLSLTAASGGLAAVLVGAQLAALKASGLLSIKPSGGNAFQALIRQVQGNWMWLIVTGIGLAIAIIAGLMIFGSQRAPEYIFRIVGGIVILVVVAPALVH